MNAEVYRKLDNVAFNLNAGAYRQQMHGRTRPLRHFNPCPKATTITAALAQPGTLFGPTLDLAALVPCSCHPGLTSDDMFNPAYYERANG